MVQIRMTFLFLGTNLTQKELDEKVISQLMEHKLLLDEKEIEKGTKKEKDSKVEVCYALWFIFLA